jgi:23S rRNA (uracil1939-C5)-methyltransferase
LTAPPHCEDEPGTIALEIATLTHGSDAVARHEGRVVFVPAVAPGDRVRVRLVDEHRSYARAEVVHRCAAGSVYREPPCPFVAACGGCPWQQVAYAAQLEAKARNVRETLARIARVTPRRELPIIPAPDEWRYRHRIRLHVDARRRLGYLRPRSHEVVEMDDCLVADPLLIGVLAPLRAALPALRTSLSTVELATNGRGGVVVAAVASGAFAPDDDAALARLAKETPEVAGVQIDGRGWREIWGDPRIAIAVGAEPPVVQRAGSFTQVNPAANRLLVDAVVTLAAPARRVLDLFCGSGNLSLPLARAGARVVGVDRHRDAIEAAQTSASAAALDATRFELGPADRFLRQQGLAGAELVVLDPPRTGAAAVVTQLARLRPRRILYVSCDPATLARDVATLTEAGYVVDRVQAIDLFPQTQHVETLLEATLWTDPAMGV